MCKKAKKLRVSNVKREPDTQGQLLVDSAVDQRPLRVESGRSAFILFGMALGKPRPTNKHAHPALFNSVLPSVPIAG